jgi:sialate O-acetylesterase
VRYGWHATAEPNLMNKEGLPASPFRTHDWTEAAVEPQGAS